MMTEEEVSSNMNELTSLYLDEPFLVVSASDESTTLQLDNVANKNRQRLSTKGILTLMNHYDSIRELSLSYSLLSNELLRALSSNEALHLETLRVEAHPELKPPEDVSQETWFVFANHSPNLNFVLLTYLNDARDYDALLATHVPLTHLYFGDSAPSSAIARVAERCPRLTELVVGAYGPDTIDEILIAAARGCPRLSAVGLGDCELTCSGLIKFVSLCCERLRMLYVLDTSLLEDAEHDVMEVSAKVSSLLGKSWHPHYVPYW
ncbi:F-box/LRR-repeat protein 3 isoform X1 [Nasonia vitripennis]|uniref:Uncharacterized protein n=1 Tax=Nasonia vitripennis TaxID=7425 RepID=A0A7M7TBJ9_NASVI|nr:F-box/LRR-repeat protein 3 isoform X1 [Nasonia vitripennis]XP_031789542.1 F-box/LRR-repeat protein 3 isoform X1 [Nasonia vitripennis]